MAASRRPMRWVCSDWSMLGRLFWGRPTCRRIARTSSRRTLCMAARATHTISAARRAARRVARLRRSRVASRPWSSAPTSGGLSARRRTSAASAATSRPTASATSTGMRRAPLTPPWIRGLRGSCVRASTPPSTTSSPSPGRWRALVRTLSSPCACSRGPTPRWSATVGPSHSRRPAWQTRGPCGPPLGSTRRPCPRTASTCASWRAPWRPSPTPGRRSIMVCSHSGLRRRRCKRWLSTSASCRRAILRSSSWGAPTLMANGWPWR
mmetsp:Transcript_45703/g.131816  ORF Transcript_45703/g.131816 Transcript_45703/m.131816 type:complete len:266 (+) Transcript_45703:322-1119(+)